MDAKELLLFRNYPGIDEPVISGGFGNLSIRNLIVLSIFGSITFTLYKLLIPINFSIQDNPLLFIITIIPVIIGLSLTIVKPQFGSADSIILSLIYISQKNKKAKQKVNVSKKSKAKKSTVLRFGKILVPQKVSEQNTIQEIVCSDFDELKAMKIKLTKNDGSVFKDQLVKCYIENDLIDTLKTSLDGILLVKIKPENEGKKKLVIKTNDDQIILEKLLYFKKK